VLDGFWKTVAAEQPEVLRMMIAALAVGADRIDRDSRQCARRFLLGEFREIIGIAEIGIPAELLRKIEPLVAA
jgi:hypothetical protein